MNREARQLKRDLRDLGASKGEAAELTRAAERLVYLHVPKLSDAGRERIASRLPVDVENIKPARSLHINWAMAGGLAVIVLVAGVLFAVPAVKRHEQADEHTHEATQQQQVEEQLQQQIQQLQTLQEQPTVDDQAVQKAKDDFNKAYQQYQQLNTDKKVPNPYSTYQQQWWWPQLLNTSTNTQPPAPLPVPDQPSRGH